MNELDIQDSDGRTIIEPTGFSAAPRAALQALEVSGGRILFDVAEPRTGLRVEVTDRDAAGGWLPLVYPAAAAIPPEAAASAVSADTGPLYGTIARLMTAMWLHRSWPESGEGIRDIDMWVLDAEAAELALSAGALFADAGLAASLIRPHLDRLASTLDPAQNVNAGDGSLAVRVAARLSTAATEAGAAITTDDGTLHDERNEALLREAHPTPDDEYDAFRISHLVEGIVRMRLQAAYATEGVWTPDTHAMAPFAAEILGARGGTRASVA
jgi:hypothetical protein